MKYLERVEQAESFEHRITAALERRADPAVPAGFAARVASTLPATRHARASLHLGRTAAVIASVLMLAAMLWLAPHSAPRFTDIAFDAELLLMAELATVAAWLVLNWREV